MREKKKLFGEERRNLILSLLKNANTPITGGELAKRTNVSRQVIVNDVTLLKARKEPIIATSQGYMYLSPKADRSVEKTIACQHTPDQAEAELIILVDHGITVKDVTIEHLVYGDLTASIMVSNRKEVEQFIHKITSTGAAYLSELTGGVHLHTLLADKEEQLNEAEMALKQAGFLMETNEMRE
ncbi:MULTISPECIES: transcription repressor NadR [Clostridia]|uniref:transcription repressor NadR n=1 Tax=Clostridia TaxID=186801 RepID=UPI000EA2F612|nr:MULTISPECIES: transcription repressor NadR [Clostridia]NBJ68019.1 transcription repressor NadR [Roseburia sp. 1XD42-34]RKI82460.1 transcription repressor NadR [Clostridium sp. 1xD42-85]